MKELDVFKKNDDDNDVIETLIMNTLVTLHFTLSFQLSNVLKHFLPLFH